MKLRKDLTSALVLSSYLFSFSLSCNPQQSGNSIDTSGKSLRQIGDLYSNLVTQNGNLKTPVIPGLLTAPNNEPPDWGDPEPLTVNPHLERLDEKYSKCRGIDIREISVLEIQELFASHQLTTVELTKCYLERQDRMNDVLRVVVEVNPDVLNEAVRLDLERKLGQNRGLLHGIPVLLKDAIGTLDLTETTLGSPALVGIRPKRDADVVTTLRKSGALILGKSHCQELYGFRGTNIPWGWSGRGGQTRNAYNLSVSPQGSSSGSAVGVAANLIPVAIGSETDGSILSPASILRIVGMKPTIGLPSVKGAIPLSHNQDHIGPMARTVIDAAILLDGMISEEERPKHHPESYAQHLLEGKITVIRNKTFKKNLGTIHIRPFRVGVLRYPFWDTTVIDSINIRYQLPQLERMLLAMKGSSYFNVMDPVEATFRNISTSKMFIVLYHDFKHDFNNYLKNDVINHYPLPRPPNLFLHTPDAYTSAISPSRRIASLQDVIEYNDEHPTPQGYNQVHLINSQATDGLQNETYIEARDSNRVATREFLDSVFNRYNLDAVVTPNDYRIEGILRPELEDFPVFGYTMACISGYPSINIPAGIGLREAPFGMTFIGKPYDEPVLLQVAYAAEQVFPQRTTPKFLI